MVSIAYASIQPWTVVIVSLHASVADAAVPRAGGSNDFTVGAKLYWVDKGHKAHEIDIFWFYYEAWVSALSNQIE